MFYSKAQTPQGDLQSLNGNNGPSIAKDKWNLNTAKGKMLMANLRASTVKVEIQIGFLTQTKTISKYIMVFPEVNQSTMLMGFLSL